MRRRDRAEEMCRKEIKNFWRELVKRRKLGEGKLWNAWQFDYSPKGSSYKYLLFQEE